MSVQRDELYEYLQTRMGVDTGAICDDSPLFSSGLVDSFAMVDLVFFLESKGGFKIGPLDVNLDNLDTVERILGFAGRLAAR